MGGLYAHPPWQMSRFRAGVNPARYAKEEDHAAVIPTPCIVQYIAISSRTVLNQFLPYNGNLILKKPW